MNKIKVSSKKVLIKILIENGYEHVGGTKHEKWTNGVISVYVPRHEKNFSRMCAERILKTAKIDLQD
jgi:hypothetical protein